MMATLTLIGENKIQVINTEETPSLDNRIGKAANEDSWTDGSCPTTPSQLTGLAVNGRTIADLGRSNPFRSRKDSITTANLNSFRHNSPLILSSRSVTSIVSNPRISNVWDSPQTPCRGSNKKFEAYDLTPITPPTSLSPPEKRLSKILTPYTNSNAGTMFEKIEASIVRASEQDPRKDSLVEEEDFKPKKLVRGLTAEFLAIAAANATAAQGKYNLRPSFDFSITLTQPAPALAQKETKTYPKVSNNGQSCRRSRGAKPQTGVVSRNIISQTDMRTLLEEVVPRDLQMRLEKAPLQCVASLIKKPQERCRYKAKAPREFDKDHLKSLAQCIDSAALTENVDKIIRTILCGTHMISANKRLDKLQRLVASPAHIANDELSRSSNSEKSTSSCGPCHAVPPKENKEKHTRGVPHTEAGSVTAQAIPTATAIINPTRPVPPLTRSYSPEFYPYRPKKWEGVSVQDALRKTITQPLNPTDLDVGFIYVFWDVKHFGMVKIGRTNDLQKRLEEWNKDCKRKHRYHTELPMIPHVSRVERLIHMELKQHRKSRRCESCNKSHVEWFEVSETHAVKIFQKWRQWIVQKPYELDARSGEWTLRPEMLASLSQLCEPVLLPPLAENKLRRPPRRSSRISGQQNRDGGS